MNAPLALPKWQLTAASVINELIHETRRMNAYRASGAAGGGYAACPTSIYPEDIARIIALHDPVTKEPMTAHEEADTMCPSRLPQPSWTA